MSSDKYLEHNLKTHLARFNYPHSFNQIYEYTLLPAGKFFRPKLLIASFAESEGMDQALKDLQDPFSPLSLMASSLEIHHTYTLIHDDMPCMDDDPIRRGRPSAHIQFGQWQALLAGDGLHALSYRLVSKIKHQNQALILKLMSHTLGTKGLIFGQALDLSGEMNQNFESLERTHLLKTARLIQLSLISGHLLSSKSNYQQAKQLALLGEIMGITFQLIDDYSELYEQLSPHELSINPWLHHPTQTSERTLEYLARLPKLFQSCPLLEKEFQIYGKKMLSTMREQKNDLDLSHLVAVKTLFEQLCLAN